LIRSPAFFFGARRASLELHVEPFLNKSLSSSTRQAKLASHCSSWRRWTTRRTGQSLSSPLLVLPASQVGIALFVVEKMDDA